MKKTPSSGKSLISTYSVLGVVANLSLSGSGRKVWWGGRLFEAGRLLNFSAFRMGAFSRWALIRGWALIRINTVPQHQTGTILFHFDGNKSAKIESQLYPP